MKKLLIVIAVIMAVSSPLSVVYAYENDNRHDRTWTEAHDPDWRSHHDQEWRDHDREWRDYDREWLRHRDRHWREIHAAMWGDWYQWHRDNVNINIVGDGFDLDINI